MIALCRRRIVPALLCTLAIGTAPQCEAAEPVAGQRSTTSAGQFGQFGLDLLRAQQAAERAPANLAFSPLGVTWALSMVHAGADGETAREIAAAVHHVDTGEAVHDQISKLSSLLSPPKDALYTLRHANRLWGAAGYDYQPDFLRTLREHYDAELFVLDFQNDAASAIGEINAWIAEQSANRIQRLVSARSVDANTVLLLTNAVYFRGAWLRPFPQAATTNRPFHLANGESVQVPMMQQIGSFRFAQSERATLLALPYRGDRLSLLVLLPAEKGSLTELERTLSFGELQQLLASAAPKEVDVALPRFEISTNCSLKDALARSGVASAFGPDANLSRITGKRNLFLQDIAQQTFVKVDESGTEATAGTAAVVSKSVPQADVRFHADRPFVYLIVDEPTQAILFLGHFAQP